MNNDQLRNRVKHFFIISSLLMLAVMVFIQYNRQQSNTNSFFFPGDRYEKVEYWDNGNIRYKGQYDGYLKDGEWLYYTEEGKLRLKERYKKGDLVSSEEVLTE